MNILYCGDKNISAGVAISAYSLALRTREPLDIYILTAAPKVEGRTLEALPRSFCDLLSSRLREISPGTQVRLFDVTGLFDAAPPAANMGTRFTPCCMLRLYADLVPEIPDRILYLDNDVVCIGDLSGLYATELGGAELAGVRDYYGSHFFRRRLFVRDYLNSGVLLLDMKKIREDGLFRRARRLCAERKMFLPDQTALNRLAHKKLILPRRFNEQRREHDDTVLRHFTTTFRFFPRFRSVTVKPWQKEKMHSVLGLYGYDELIDAGAEMIKEYKKAERQATQQQMKGRLK